jgi:hypothetical protein
MLQLFRYFDGASRVQQGFCAQLEQPHQPDVPDIDEAFLRHEAFDERAARIIELRFFGGSDSFDGDVEHHPDYADSR